jgi:formate dehydrogenase major subunit
MAQIFLRLKALYQKEGGTVPEPIVNLDWRYKDPGEPTPEELSRELNGYANEDIADANDPSKVAIAKGKQLVNFSVLRDDGKTTCGCWIYSGCFNEAGNNMARRDNTDPDGAGVYGNWAWSWPLNRRVLYNRASADTDGNPWDPSRKLLWWNGSKWVGYDVPDIAPDAKPGVVSPFIMNAEGTGRLFALAQMRDGPFPAHYEPFESPVVNLVAPKIRGNPASRVFKNDWNQLGDAAEFPYAGTSYRLTEHFHFWTKHVRFNAVMQPEFFVEISEQLAAEKGIKSGHWVQVWSKRGTVKAKAVVTKRINTLLCDGKPVHVIGVPLHWAFIGETKEGFGPNSLTPFVGDANSETPEFKAFLVDIKPISGPHVVNVAEGPEAEEGDFSSLISDTLGDRSRTDF